MLLLTAHLAQLGAKRAEDEGFYSAYVQVLWRIFLLGSHMPLMAVMTGHDRPADFRRDIACTGSTQALDGIGIFLKRGEMANAEPCAKRTT